MLKKYHLALAVIVVLSMPLTSAPSFAHEKEIKSMTMVHTGNPDVDFVKNMIPHHKMAIDMAEKELNDGKDPEVRTMAEKVKDDQMKEIEDMQAWLDKNESKTKGKE